MTRPKQSVPVKAITKQPRIMAIEFIRVVVVTFVITSHVMATGALYDSTTSGAVWMISHASRNLFVMISALVLWYTYGSRPDFSVKKFYLKRFPLIIIPYATWTIIYQLADGLKQHTVGDFLSVFWYNFINASAMYHLYFLLVTMQFYLIFPLVRLAFNKFKKYPWRILIGSFVLQLGIGTLIHTSPDISWLNWWLDHPDNFILGYQFYLIGGLVIAANLEPIRKWVLAHFKAVWATTIVTSSIGIAWYFWQVSVGTAVDHAADIFQPFFVVETVALALAIIASAFRWSERGAKGQKLVASIGQDSFGIYLGHVFLINYLVFLQPSGNDPITALLTLVIAVPSVYLISFVCVEIIRRTWFSLPITGRKRTPLRVERQVITNP